MAAIAERTADFSYPYLKELVVSAMIRWTADARPAAMDAETAAPRAHMATRGRHPHPQHEPPQLTQAAP